MFERYQEERTRPRKIAWSAVGVIAAILVAVFAWTRHSRERDAIETMNELAEAQLERAPASLEP